MVFMNFCKKHELVALHFESYKKRDFATYARGKTRIDFTLVSHDVLPDIVKTGYTPFAEFLHSDNCGEFLILHYK